MSTSKDMLNDYARIVVEHPAKAELINRVNMRMFAEWMITKDEKQQKEIRYKLEAMGEFFKEVNIVLSENQDLGNKIEGDLENAK